MSWSIVCAVADLQPGQHRVIDVDGTAVVVFNLDGAFFALEDVCTHDGGQLTGGCVDGDEIVCPRHGARFSIRTGAALTPPAYDATAKFPVRVSAAGQIEVRDDRWD
ncbi:MAG: non-heme iron oxygenase ferredoxin subunit [Burkholderiales bacterium]|nr:non-heme iron oxygenase ferredoxin subunit [Burkholderiales bacterium]